jgi:hypothetical protein
VPQTFELSALILAYLQYYYIDIQLQILSMPSITAWQMRPCRPALNLSQYRIEVVDAEPKELKPVQEPAESLAEE